MAGNQFLAALAAPDAMRLRANLEDVELEQDQVLLQADALLTYVYFPHDSVVSLQILGSDGTVVEAASIGNEGLVGLGGHTTTDVSYARQIVQLPGRAARVPRGAFLTAIGKSISLRSLVNRHTDAVMAHVLQTSACNAQHTTEERMARWLLMASDRCGTERINLSHDDLAIAFGVRRPTVTLILRSLQVARILETTRRAVAVIDRTGLEQISCECYLAIRRNYERVFAERVG